MDKVSQNNWGENTIIMVHESIKVCIGLITWQHQRAALDDAVIPDEIKELWLQF